MSKLNLEIVNNIYAEFAVGNIPAVLEFLTRRSSGLQLRILPWRIAALIVV